MTSWQRPITAAIDVLNNWVGRFTCLLLIPIIASMVYEVVAAKMFTAPTLWVYDVSRMLAGVLFMLGAGYALMRGVHIRADFIYRNWTTRTQATVDAILYLLFYFPAMLFFFWSATDYTIAAFNPRGDFAFDGWERASDSTWAPVLARPALQCRSAPSCSCCRACLSCFAPSTIWARNASGSSSGSCRSTSSSSPYYSSAPSSPASCPPAAIGPIWSPASD